MHQRLVKASSQTVTTLRDYIKAETKFLRKLKQVAFHKRLHFIVLDGLFRNERMLQQSGIVGTFSNVLLQTITNTSNEKAFI